MPRLASHAVHLRDEYTYTEENVTQKVKALRGLCALHGIKADIIKGESGSQSRAVGHGAMAEGWWTPRRRAAANCTKKSKKEARHDEWHT